jgi:predicted small secreted protein
MGTKPQRRCSVDATFSTPSGDSKMRKLMVLAALAVSLGVAACNTVQGAGKDVSAAGNAVSDTAQDAKH